MRVSAVFVEFRTVQERSPGADALSARTLGNMRGSGPTKAATPHKAPHWNCTTVIRVATW